MSTGGSTKAIIAALTANMGIAVTKFVAWGLTGASSMLAEAIHSVADSANQLLLLVGGKRSQQAPDEAHQFGYGRLRYVYAFIVSIVLFTLGGVFALYEAWHKYREGQEGKPNELLESQWWWVPIVVLVAAMLMEGLSLRTAVRESNPLRGRQTWGQFIRRSKSPELPVVLLEDSGALLGLVFALFGVGLTLVTGDPIFDVIGTAIIGILLVCIAGLLAVEMTSLLVGESASPEKTAIIAAALSGSPGVERIIHVKTLYLGPDEVLITAKIGVSGAATATDVARIIDDAEAAIRGRLSVDATIYLEPDIFDPQYTPARPSPRADKPH
jgi:cation diffusion facilitator family transporter